MTDRNCERKVPHWGPEQPTKCPLFLYNSCRQRLGSQLAALSLPLSLPLQPHLSGCTPACLGTSSICSLGSCYLGPSQSGTGKIIVGGRWPGTIWSGPHSPLGVALVPGLGWNSLWWSRSQTRSRRCILHRGYWDYFQRSTRLCPEISNSPGDVPTAAIQPSSWFIQGGAKGAYSCRMDNNTIVSK